ncbi:MAG: hypothetical protein JWO09_3899 [Bacteroidetes bacterium]|nr:hypothetical protein [Bacteroidota bacterium]
MNAYILLSQKNVRINDIPPRLMWNIDENWDSPSSGYCGETSILSAGLLYGQYVPMYLIRQLLSDYFNGLWGTDAQPSSTLTNMWLGYSGLDWSEAGSPGKDYKKSEGNFQAWFGKRGQYYCQVLPQIGDNSVNPSFDPINTVLGNLHLSYEHFSPKVQDTKNNFIPWMKGHVLNGHPVIIGVQDFLAGSNDNDFDHIVIVIGWGSNNDFSNTSYFPDDEIVFIDHGLVISGQQPYGGSIPYYFRYVMETPENITETGGWLPDGGCPDPANPAWNFIMDLGPYRQLNVEGEPCSNGNLTCNTYQLAQSPTTLTKGSDGNAGFAITGLSDTLPAGVQVRIDTDCYYQVPCITAQQAQTGTQPASAQIINHKITISGLTESLSYNVWLFTAKNTEVLMQIPTTGFNEYGKEIKAECYTVSGQTSSAYTYPLAADTALFVRCVATTDK